MRVRIGWMASAAALATAAPAAAQERTVSEIVVTAAPYAVSVDSLTSSVNVVTTEQLQTTQPGSLGDVLGGLPGLRSTFFGPGAGRPVIRGLSGPRVMILQNGIGQVDVSDVSPDHAVASDPGEAARIEVLRGPSTLAYGGSAIGGVVNVIDERVPTARGEGGRDGRIARSASTVDNGWGGSAHLKSGSGPWVFVLEGLRRQTEDYAVPANPVSDILAAAAGVTPEHAREVANSATDVTEYGAGLGYVGEDGFLGASIRRTTNDYGVPYAQIEGEPPGGDEGPVGIALRQTRIDVRGETGLNLGPFDKVKFAGGWAKYRHQELLLASGETGTQFDAKGYEGRLELVQREAGGRQGAVGFQGLHRSLAAAGDEAFVPPVTIDEVGVFTLQRLDKGGWGLEGGLRLDRRKLSADNAGRIASDPAAASGIDWATAPDRRAFTGFSASAALFLRPAEGWFVSLNLSHNQRAPTEYELFADGPHAGTGAFEIGDPFLNKEKVNSAELSARYSNGRARVEGHVYTARYGGFIQEAPTGEVEDGLPVQQFQAVDARFWGAELSGSVEAWRSGGHSLSVEGVFDWVRGSSDAGPIPRIPPWSATGRLVYEGPRVDGRLEVRRVASQDRVSPFELATDGYTMVNAFVAVRPVKDSDVRVFAEVRNLGDVEAREHASFLKDIAPLPGRNVRVGVAIEF